MPTAQDIRKIALALEGVTEVDHWGRPSFRTKKRIFAVIRPDGLFLHLPDERKEFLFAVDPQIFIRFMWGKTANLIVDLKRIGKMELKALIAEAYENAKPAERKKGLQHRI
ncbi:MAG TPA: MmcQ/YjbR family DNA-binding protein [Rhizomicrobium sp.]|nr:MmcQ/YjbR family DNA-binding protein [Rhizomicrobium sp.]